MRQKATTFPLSFSNSVKELHFSVSMGFSSMMKCQTSCNFHRLITLISHASYSSPLKVYNKPSSVKIFLTSSNSYGCAFGSTIFKNQSYFLHNNLQHDWIYDFYFHSLKNLFIFSFHRTITPSGTIASILHSTFDIFSISPTLLTEKLFLFMLIISLNF